MVIGKLTAKLRDAVPVCFLVDGKEIKRYKNIEIPDELKMLEYQDFKFDIPLNGNITFKFMFAPGILPEEWPQARVPRTRKPFTQVEQPQEFIEDMEVEPNPQDKQVTEALSELTVEVDAQVAGEQAAEFVEAMAEDQAINAGSIEGNSKKRMLVNTKKPESIDITALPVSDVRAKKPTGKDNGKKGARSKEDVDK